jgi:hypothetical protein
VDRPERIAEVSSEEVGDPIGRHDPARIADGIEPTDDPIKISRMAGDGCRAGLEIGRASGAH